MDNPTLDDVRGLVKGSARAFQMAYREDAQFRDAVDDYIYACGAEDGNNYGISFHACGYNSRAMDEFQRRMLEEYDLTVF